MIDEEGYRLNVGIVLSNADSQLLWARRVGQDAWQFPQGGIKDDETPEQALLRELWEEVGLSPHHVEIVGCTQGWLHYNLPRHLIRHGSRPVCIGQKQIWFLLRFTADEKEIHLGRSPTPEFDSWRWVDYWRPVNEVVAFKRTVYQQALTELEELLTRPSVMRTV